MSERLPVTLEGPTPLSGPCPGGGEVPLVVCLHESLFRVWKGRLLSTGGTVQGRLDPDLRGDLVRGGVDQSWYTGCEWGRVEKEKPV